MSSNDVAGACGDDPLVWFAASFQRARQLRCFGTANTARTAVPERGQVGVCYTFANSGDDAAFVFFTNFETHRARDPRRYPCAALILERELELELEPASCRSGAWLCRSANARFSRRVGRRDSDASSSAVATSQRLVALRRERFSTCRRTGCSADAAFSLRGLGWSLRDAKDRDARACGRLAYTRERARWERAGLQS